MKKTSFNVLFILLLVSLVSHASASSEARYFKGKVKVFLNQATACYLEVLYSDDPSQVVLRLVSTLPHLSSQGTPIWIAIGPYAADYIPSKAIYRYQDPTDGALVKDLVLNIDANGVPIRHGISYWHSEAGHHDPVFCENLTEAISVPDLENMKDVFLNFDDLKF